MDRAKDPKIPHNLFGKPTQPAKIFGTFEKIALIGRP